MYTRKEALEVQKEFEERNPGVFPTIVTTTNGIFCVVEQPEVIVDIMFKSQAVLLTRAEPHRDIVGRTEIALKSKYIVSLE